ncbi:NAD(+) diphosphatase [Aminipila luticellarii]|uniref:NAD(+) diphosphatase n=1 Tax=Aminipila luticellarii TaxID=2507160 RepID=A0A410PXV8_9FIRM|nr:NAD(+) diphosphatase [Aminipila luticellarii]QAT43793.1 NAD(+) diphosphatase [Aminipila luticellarii]
MIQDIEPRKFDITFKDMKPKNTDYALLFCEEFVLMKQPDGQERAAEFLTFNELNALEEVREVKKRSTYLFSIDDNKYFSVNIPKEKEMDCRKKVIREGKVLAWISQNAFRALKEKWLGFAGITAVQINRWFLNHRYCGRCGKPLIYSKTERSLICENCHITEYPKISPAIIVGIVDGDKLLLTRYADRPYKRYALIAGFSEVGEALEDTVKREVMEEVGLKVKDITYYKSQPWSFSDSLLAGFFARLDGDNTVTLADGELAEGTWFSREQIPVNQEEIALTAEMIRYFADGNDVFK